MFEPLTEGDVRKRGNLLYPLFLERCGVHMHRAVDAIGSGNLPLHRSACCACSAGQCACTTRSLTSAAAASGAHAP
jgi:GntR family transcriptional regulator